MADQSKSFVRVGICTICGAATGVVKVKLIRNFTEHSIGYHCNHCDPSMHEDIK